MTYWKSHPQAKLEILGNSLELEVEQEQWTQTQYKYRQLRSLFSVSLSLTRPIRGLAVQSPGWHFTLPCIRPRREPQTVMMSANSSRQRQSLIFAFAVDSPRSHLCLYSVRQEVTESQNPQSTVLGGNVKHCVRQCYGVLTTLIKARRAREMWGQQCVVGS